MSDPHILFVSGSAGLGHVTRDLAIASALRGRWPELRLLWLAGEPAVGVLREAGEALAPECRQFAGETEIAEEAAGPFSLYLTHPGAFVRRPVWCCRTMMRLCREQRSNFTLFQQLTARERPDMVIADEAYDIMLNLARKPALKPSLMAMLFDFVGMEAGTRSPIERLAVAAMNWSGVRLLKRFPKFCDLTLMVGEEEDVADKPLGPLQPNRRQLARELVTYVGYIVPFDPEDFRDRASLRARLGYGSEPLIVCAIGGTAIGKALLELCGQAFVLLRDRVPTLRMVAVAGPRLSPASVNLPAGVERRGYVHRLYEHLAACDLGIVQGGGTTTLELTALRRPFLYFPLTGHFEQRVHVASRIERHRAGVRMEFDATTPEELAIVALAHLASEVKSLPIRTDGACRAAHALVGLLETTGSA